MSAKIAPLAYSVRPRIQFEAMQTLQKNLGLETGRDVIERTVYETSDRLAKLERSLFDGDLEQVQTLAVSLITITTQIGLVEFAEVASDLVYCVDCGDNTALYAVAARLFRLGETSMFQAVQYAGVTG